MLLIFLTGCKSGGGDSSLSNTFMNPTAGVFNSSINSVSINSEYITLNGTKMDGVTSIYLVRDNGTKLPINIENKTTGIILGKALQNVSFALGEVFKVVIGNAYGQSVFDAVFTVGNRSIGVNQLSGALGGVNDDGVSNIRNGDTLVWNINRWVARNPSENSQRYIGIWDAVNMSPNINLLNYPGLPDTSIISPRNGDYFVVQGSGRQVFNCPAVSCNDLVEDGDWVIWNSESSKWDVIRNVYATALPDTIPWSRIDKTGARLQEVVGINGSPVNGNSIVFENGNWRYGTPVVNSTSFVNGITEFITSGSITSEKITNGTITVNDLNTTGLSLPTSGILLGNLDGTFSKINCATSGQIIIWTLVGFGCGNVTNSFNEVSIGGMTVWRQSSLSPGGENIAIGNLALDTIKTGNLNTGTVANLAIGDSSGLITTGGGNVSLGNSSLIRNTTGSRNTAIGYNALPNNVTGSNNTVMGYRTGYTESTSTNISGDQNTAVGSSIQYTGDLNSVFGANSIITGSNNVSIGAGQVVKGTRNIFIGNLAGVSVTSGTGNVILGGYRPSVFPNDSTSDQNVFIADGLGTLKMRFNSSGNGVVGNETATIDSQYKLKVDGDFNATGTVRANGVTLSSDFKLKKDIRPIGDTLEKLSGIDGVLYNWKNNEFPDLKLGDKPQMGVIAQQVEKVFPEAVHTDSKGIKSVFYNMLIAPLIDAVNNLAKSFKLSESRISKLEKENKELKEFICSSNENKPKFCKR